MEDAGGELYVFCSKGRPVGGPKHDDISDLELNKVHIFVLNNTDDEEIEEHIRNHKLKLEAECSANIDQHHEREFLAWFRQQLGKDWCVVQKANPCSSYEVLEFEQGPGDEIIQKEEPGFVLCVDLGEIPQLDRDVPSFDSIDATIVNAATAETCIENDYDDEFIDDEDCDVDCGDETLATDIVKNVGLRTDDDDYVDDDGPGKGRKPLVKKRRIESLGLRDSISSQGQKSAQGMSTSTTEHNVSTKSSPFHLRDENDEETHLAGDSDIPLTPMSACSAKSSTFVKRGQTKNLSGRENDDDAPHKVKLDDCYKRVVGPNSQSFMNESSVVARKFWKHNVTKWSQLEKDDREAMCQRVMAMRKRNTENRAKSKEPNFTGTLSLARKGFRIKKTPIDLFEYSRTSRKTGTMPGETSKSLWDLEGAGYEPKEICIAAVGKLPGSAGRALTKSYYLEEARHEKERADVAEKETKETYAKLEKMAVEQETLKKTLVAENEVLKESLAVLLERVNRMEAQNNA
ncbi:OLC1v1030503C1 [Oldenlandia corymbosa var. corymbosa]|uniref:OLC1v1030503C1 n=1 Tax=Oldenlandia corymbosa var. corymbosa TaxID=529605 RepID=A0AAV1CH86_OLDCO|nr:OLC1v1030503C1 [Oldenlandia corymbosa var. corymbosa]